MNRTLRNMRMLPAFAGAALALGVPALAQTAPPAETAPPTTSAPVAPGGRQGQGGRGVSLAALPVGTMNTLLKLTDEQKTKITAIQDKAKTDATAAADRPAKMQVGQKASEEIKALLTPEQVKSLDEAMPALNLITRSRALPVPAMDDVKLTKEQFTKIGDLAKEIADAQKAMTPEDRRAKRQEMMADAKTKIVAMLTTEQKDALAKYEKAHPPVARTNA